MKSFPEGGFDMKRYYRPQLARGGGIKDIDKYLDDPRYLPQEKIDGVRMIVHKDAVGRMSCYTRTLSKETGKPIRHTKKFRYMLSRLRCMMPPGTVLDGEIVAGRAGSNEVMKYLGRSGTSAYIMRRLGGFKYKYFDCLAWNHLDHVKLGTAYERRYDDLLKIGEGEYRDKYGSWYDTYGKPELLPLYEETTAEGKRKIYKKIVDKGGEGLVLKSLDAPYLEDKRHDGIIKAKERVTYDVVIMGVTPAKETSIKKGQLAATPTRIAGQVGDIRYGMYHSGKLVYLGRVSGFSDEVRRDLNDNWQQYVAAGRVLEVEAQQQNKSGALRHATFKNWRDDKTASDCIWESVFKNTGTNEFGMDGKLVWHGSFDRRCESEIHKILREAKEDLTA